MDLQWSVDDCGRIRLSINGFHLATINPPDPDNGDMMWRARIDGFEDRFKFAGDETESEVKKKVLETVVIYARSIITLADEMIDNIQ